MILKEILIFSIFLSFPIASSNAYAKIQDKNIVTVRKKIVNPSAEISAAIAHSIELALQNCQIQFQWDRWNCPPHHFLSKRTSHLIDREAAFVKAITSAALVYTFTRNCSRGEFTECGCDTWHHSGCSDRVDFGEQIADDLIDHDDSRALDAQSYVNMHNRRAGRIAVRKSLTQHCRCHGLSGSCSTQTCWTSMNPFPEISADLRRMYDRARRLAMDNSGALELDGVTEDQLVYLLDSPNYCEANVVHGWQGVRRRQCSRAKGEGVGATERKSCRNLCRACGLRVRKEQRIKHTRCNCKFNWCCDVVCDVCSEMVEEHFCA